jgi:hypothetical protein
MPDQSPKAQISGGKSRIFANALRTTRSTLSRTPQRSQIRYGENPQFNFVTKYFADKSRQDWCSELKRASATWFGIEES